MKQKNNNWLFWYFYFIFFHYSSSLHFISSFSTKTFILWNFQLYSLLLIPNIFLIRWKTRKWLENLQRRLKCTHLFVYEQSEKGKLRWISYLFFQEEVARHCQWHRGGVTSNWTRPTVDRNRLQTMCDHFESLESKHLRKKSTMNRTDCIRKEVKNRQFNCFVDNKLNVVRCAVRRHVQLIDTTRPTDRPIVESNFSPCRIEISRAPNFICTVYF